MWLLAIPLIALLGYVAFERASAAGLFLTHLAPGKAYELQVRRPQVLAGEPGDAVMLAVAGTGVFRPLGERPIISRPGAPLLAGQEPAVIPAGDLWSVAVLYVPSGTLAIPDAVRGNMDGAGRLTLPLVSVGEFVGNDFVVESAKELAS